MITISGLEPKSYHVTIEGMKQLREQLISLQQSRLELANELRDLAAQSSGATALEDSARILNQNQFLEIEGQITLLERVITMAKVIKKPKLNDRVQLGSQVLLVIEGKRQTYTVVSSIEANPAEGKVSNESPLGQSLLGKRVNDSFEVVSPKRRAGMKALILGIA
jgi:transcription elongation factor GreA